MKVKVSFQGKTLEYVMEETDSLSDLLLVLKRDTEADLGVCNTRMLCKGKDISSERGMLCNVVGDGGKVLVMSTNMAEVEKMREVKKAPAPALIKPINLSSEATKKRKQQGPATSHYIHAIEALPLPRQQEAHAILTQIASDEGVKGVLEKHKWNIGKLMEISPLDQKLLGLNKNKGEVILLRVRHLTSPDDSDLFLPYKEIRDTMLHELTHCAHGPHDEKFYTLFRQLVKECEAFDWRRGGQRLGGSAIYRPDDTDETEAPRFSSSSALGGDIERFEMLKRTGATPAQIAGAAAALRLSTMERKIEQSCGCSQVQSAPEPAPEPEPVPVSVPVPVPKPEIKVPAEVPEEQVSTGCPVFCPACKQEMPAGCSERYLSNHMDSCTKPPLKMECPICQLVMPEGSSERYFSNHVEQCVGEQQESAPEQPVLRLQGSVSAPSVSPVELPASEDAACPICNEAFPAGSSTRYMSNHVDQCLSKA